MTLHLTALAFDANDPARLAPSGPVSSAGRWSRCPRAGSCCCRATTPEFRIEFYPTDATEDRPQPDALRPDEHLAGGPAGDGGEGARARRPAPRHRPGAGRGPRGARRPRGQRVLRHRARQQLPGRHRVHRRAVERRHAGRSATSGARRWAGRWSGTRTRRPRSSRRTAARRSPGAGRRWRRRPGRTGCTSTSRHPPAVTSRPRSNGSSRSGRPRVDIGQGDVPAGS